MGSKCGQNVSDFADDGFTPSPRGQVSEVWGDA
jgi:hypothetical protein